MNDVQKRKLRSAWERHLDMVTEGFKHTLKEDLAEAKAKELRPYIEKVITKANQGTLASKRQVISGLYGLTSEANKLIKDIAPKYKERAGGYTRITKSKRRLSDGSKMAIIEFVK